LIARPTWSDALQSPVAADRSWVRLLSHELGGPIAVLRGYSALWVEDRLDGASGDLLALGRQTLPEAESLAGGLAELLEAGRSMPETLDAGLVVAVGRFVDDGRPAVQRLRASLQGRLHREGGAGRSPAAVSIVTCHAQALLLSGLVDQLSLAVGLDAQAATHRQVLDVPTWLRRLAHQIAGAITATGHRLLVEADAKPAQALVTPDLLQAAVLNLVDNPQKHSPPGSAIVVSARGRGDSVLVQVSDRGPGLPAGLAPALFARIDQPTAFDLPGLGLGLAIAAKVAEVNHGELHQTRRPGGGSVLTIVLPRAT